MKLTKLFISLVFSLSIFIGVPNLVLAAGTGNYGLDQTVSNPTVASALSATEVNKGAGTFLSKRVGSIIGALLAFIGVIFFILVIFAGFKWMISAGNEQKVSEARDLIVSAIIGLIIVLAAYSITAFIGRQLTTTSGAGGSTVDCATSFPGHSCIDINASTNESDCKTGYCPGDDNIQCCIP